MRTIYDQRSLKVDFKMIILSPTEQLGSSWKETQFMETPFGVTPTKNKEKVLCADGRRRFLAGKVLQGATIEVQSNRIKNR